MRDGDDPPQPDRIQHVTPFRIALANLRKATTADESVTLACDAIAAAARESARIVFHPHFHEAEAGGYRPTAFADPANSFHEKAMLCRAAENTCFFASVNVASPGSPTTSAIVGPDGVVRAYQPYGREGLLVGDVDLDEATGLLAGRCRMAV